MLRYFYFQPRWGNEDAIDPHPYNTREEETDTGPVQRRCFQDKERRVPPTPERQELPGAARPGLESVGRKAGTGLVNVTTPTHSHTEEESELQQHTQRARG